MEHKTFEHRLPEEYGQIFVIDATNKKIGIYLNIAAAVIISVLCLIGGLWLKPSGFLRNTPFWKELLFLAGLFLYIVLHELVHGAAYKLMTHEKLTYGFTLSVAYCGVPHIYVYRKTALIALLAPFVTFTIIFGLLIAVLPDIYSKFLAWMLCSIHIGGCAGDLYNTYLYLFKFRDPETLMQDTGPKQTFYLPSRS